MSWDWGGRIRPMSDVFISHIHEDVIAANALMRFLKKKLSDRKVTVFVSSSELELGDEWLVKIRSALKTAKIVIALFSPESVRRPWVNFEAGGAWFSEDKVLIPLCLGGLNPAKLPKPYSDIQGASLEEEDTPFYLYAKAVKVLRLGLHPLPFSNSDVDVRDLRSELSRWRVAIRAGKTLRRWEKSRVTED